MISIADSLFICLIVYSLFFSLSRVSIFFEETLFKRNLCQPQFEFLCICMKQKRQRKKIRKINVCINCSSIQINSISELDHANCRRFSVSTPSKMHIPINKSNEIQFIYAKFFEPRTQNGSPQFQFNLNSALLFHDDIYASDISPLNRVGSNANFPLELTLLALCSTSTPHFLFE